MASEKASPADVARLLEICGPFLDELRADHCKLIIASKPSEADKREEMYLFIRGLDMVVTKLKMYVNVAAYEAAVSQAAEKTEE